MNCAPGLSRLPFPLLQAYAAEVEREQQERLALERRIRAMESKVGAGLDGMPSCDGVSLLLLPAVHYLTKPTPVVAGKVWVNTATTAHSA